MLLLVKVVGKLIYNTLFLWFRFCRLRHHFRVGQRFTFFLLLRFHFLACLRNWVLRVGDVVGFGKRGADTVLLWVFHALGVQIHHLIITKLIARWWISLTHHLHLHLSVLDHSLNVWNRSFRFLDVEFLLDWWELLEVCWFIAD